MGLDPVKLSTDTNVSVQEALLKNRSEILDGFNSQVDSLLEGGLPCFIIVIVMIERYFSILRYKIRNSRKEIELMFCKAVVICMLQMFVIGLFGQLHGMPEFWLMMGIVYAIPHRRYSNNDHFITPPIY